ncbi:hypothetical protein Tco_1231487 [Tanacetum coccineum]
MENQGKAPIPQIWIANDDNVNLSDNVTKGKGSKQATNGSLGFFQEDRLREICEKHYENILSIMAEKVHQEKLKGVQTRLSYSKSSRQKAQTKEKTQLSESGSCDGKRKTKKRQSPSLGNMPRGTRPGQSPSVFSRLGYEKPTSACQRSPVSTTVFTKLGAKDKNVFTRLREKRRDIHLQLGPKVASRPKHISDRRRANSKMSVEVQNHERRVARNLIHSYGACSSKRHGGVEEVWDATDRADRRGDRPFYGKDPLLQGPKKDPHATNVKTYDGTGGPEDHLKIFWEAEKIERWAIPTWCHMLNSILIGSARVWFDKLLPESIDNYKDRFTSLTKTLKEILAMETVKLKAPPPMSGHAEGRNKNKFCEFHGDKGYESQTEQIFTAC